MIDVIRFFALVICAELQIVCFFSHRLEKSSAFLNWLYLAMPNTSNKAKGIIIIAAHGKPVFKDATKTSCD